MNAYLETLKTKQWLWQGFEQCIDKEVIASGYPTLDKKLTGGLPAKGVIECKTLNGIGEIRLFLHYLQAQQNKGLLVFIAPPAMPNSEFLHQQGINLSNLLVIQTTQVQDALWSAEQSLKSGCVRCVFIWQDQVAIHQIRRLNLACEHHEASLVIFRQCFENAFSLPVQLSLRLKAHRYGIQVAIDKHRGGKTYQDLLLDMSEAWPDLILPNIATNVVPLTAKHQQNKVS